MNQLRQKRKQLGITQIQAAHACGVSRRTYQTYEETENINETFDRLIQKLNEIAALDSDHFITNVKAIKFAVQRLFKVEYPEVECAYLFGSYARGQATGKSDIDILVVAPPMGMRFYAIAAKLEEVLFKTIDLHTHRQVMQNEALLAAILKEGIKIYG